LLQDSYINKLKHKFNINITKVLRTLILANLVLNLGLNATLEQVYAY
jgi:hypothetical protein